MLDLRNRALPHDNQEKDMLDVTSIDQQQPTQILILWIIAARYLSKLPAGSKGD